MALDEKAAAGKRPGLVMRAGHIGTELMLCINGNVCNWITSLVSFYYANANKKHCLKDNAKANNELTSEWTKMLDAKASAGSDAKAFTGFVTEANSSASASASSSASASASSSATESASDSEDERTVWASDQTRDHFPAKESIKALCAAENVAFQTRNDFTDLQLFDSSKSLDTEGQTNDFNNSQAPDTSRRRRNDIILLEASTLCRKMYSIAINEKAGLVLNDKELFEYRELEMQKYDCIMRFITGGSATKTKTTIKAALSFQLPKNTNAKASEYIQNIQSTATIVGLVPKSKSMRDIHETKSGLFVLSLTLLQRLVKIGLAHLVSKIKLNFSASTIQLNQIDRRRMQLKSIKVNFNTILSKKNRQFTLTTAYSHLIKTASMDNISAIMLAKHDVWVTEPYSSSQLLIQTGHFVVSCRACLGQQMTELPYGECGPIYDRIESLIYVQNQTRQQIAQVIKNTRVGVRGVFEIITDYVNVEQVQSYTSLFGKETEKFYEKFFCVGSTSWHYFETNNDCKTHLQSLIVVPKVSANVELADPCFAFCGDAAMATAKATLTTTSTAKSTASTAAANPSTTISAANTTSATATAKKKSVQVGKKHSINSPAELEPSSKRTKTISSFSFSSGASSSGASSSFFVSFVNCKLA